MQIQGVLCKPDPGVCNFHAAAVQHTSFLSAACAFAAFASCSRYEAEHFPLTAVIIGAIKTQIP